MHIHGNSMNVNAANLYSVGHGARSAAAERAAAVRKRLLKAAAADNDVSPEETLMIGHWLGESGHQSESGPGYTPAVPGKDPDFG